MEEPWGAVILLALMFLIPGVWFAIVAAANVAKYDRGLTALGMIVYLAEGALLTIVGVSCLLGLAGPRLYMFGFVALGISMVMEGTGRLSRRPYSIALQRIFMWVASLYWRFWHSC